MDYRQQVEYLKAGNYFFIPNDVFFYGLTPKAFAVLCYLAYISDDMGECHPSRATICKHCHIKYGACDKALRELVDNYMIEIEPRYKNNIQITSTYSLCYIRGKKKLIYNLVADLNGIIENKKRRGTDYLSGKKG
jgi:hypothetical protein